MNLILEQPKMIITQGVPLVWYDDKQETGNPECKCSYCHQVIDDYAVRIEDGFQELRLHQHCFIHLHDKGKIIIEQPDGQEEKEKV